MQAFVIKEGTHFNITSVGFVTKTFDYRLWYIEKVSYVLYVRWAQLVLPINKISQLLISNCSLSCLGKKGEWKVLDLPSFVWFVAPHWANTVTRRSAKQNTAKDSCIVLTTPYIMTNTSLFDVCVICHSGKLLFVSSRIHWHIILPFPLSFDAQIRSETFQLKNNLFLHASKI